MANETEEVEKYQICHPKNKDRPDHRAYISKTGREFHNPRRYTERS